MRTMRFTVARILIAGLILVAMSMSGWRATPADAHSRHSPHIIHADHPAGGPVVERPGGHEHHHPGESANDAGAQKGGSTADPVCCGGACLCIVQPTFFAPAATLTDPVRLTPQLTRMDAGRRDAPGERPPKPARSPAVG